MHENIVFKEIYMLQRNSKSTVNETIKSPFSSLTNFMSCSCTYCIEWSTVYSHIEFSLTADYINKTVHPTQNVARKQGWLFDTEIFESTTRKLEFSFE